MKKAISTLTGSLFHNPPLISAVKRQLRIRTIYKSALLEHDMDRNLSVFWVSCRPYVHSNVVCTLGIASWCGWTHAGIETSSIGCFG